MQRAEMNGAPLPPEQGATGGSSGGSQDAQGSPLPQTRMPAAETRAVTRKATAQELKKARARLSELEDQLQFVGQLEATLKGLNRGSTAASSEGSAGSHERTANENPSRAESNAERVELGSPRDGSPMVKRYHSGPAQDWALPGSSAGGTSESPFRVQKGRNSMEAIQGSANLDQNAALDEEEEMMRRVHTIITSTPAGGKDSFYERPSSNEQQYAKPPDNSIMLAMSLDQLRDIVKDEVTKVPLGNRSVNPKVAWKSEEDGENHDEMLSVSSTEGAKPKRALGASHIPRTLEEAVPVSCRSHCYSGFSRGSPIRMKCFEIATKARWATFFMVVTLSNSIYIAVFPGLAASAEATAGVSGGEIFDYFCVTVFLLEIVASIIAFGFMGSETTYLENSDFHKMDLFVLIATLAEYVASNLGFRGVTVRPFRLLRVFKAMIKIRTFSSVKAIIQTLKQGTSQLLIVFSILMFFVACAGIFGMAILQNSYARRCVSMERQVPSCASDFSTGWRNTCDLTKPQATFTEPGGELIRSPGYPGYLLCKIFKNQSAGEYDGKYPLDHFGRYHSCQLDLFEKDPGLVTQYCEVIENPNFGFQHFDHIGGAILAIFQVAAPDGSYDVIHNAVQSEPVVEPALWTFFFLISCLCTFLLLGLFVAVVTGTFKRVREGYGFVFNRIEPAEQASGATTPTDEEADRRGQEAAATFSANLKSYTAHMPSMKSTSDMDTETMLQAKAHQILYGNWFKHIISLVILLHGIAMAFDRYGASSSLRSLAQTSHIVANLVFSCELVLRMVAFGGVGEFWKSRFNRLELGLVFLAFVGLAAGSKFLVLLAAVRLYQLMRYFKTLFALLRSAVASTRAIANLVVFILIVALCFAVAGRYVFQDSMNATTRSNFGSFPIAMLTVFQLLTGDSWSSVVYHAMNSKDTIYGQLFAAIFIMSWFVFSKLIVTNLFVAVIIENFEVSETIANIKSDGYMASMRKMIKNAYADQYQLQVEDRQAGTVAFQQTHKKSTLRIIEKKKLSYSRAGRTQGPEGMELGQSRQIGKLVAATAGTGQLERVEDAHSSHERVLYYFQPKHPVRVFFIWLGDQFWFDLLIYTAIMVGCVFLVVTPPAEKIPNNEPVISFETMASWNFVFTLVFTVEFITHVMANGLLQTRNAYLKSGWNIVDTLVLLFAWVDETGLLAGGSVAKVLRLARALRPLRLMKRNEGMRKVIDALIRTLAPVAYVILFSMFSFVVFALIGMGIFGGRLHRCTTPGAEYPSGKLECAGAHVTEDTGIMLQRVWVPPAHNFDSFVEAGLTLFRVNTIKYVAIITDVMDITNPDQSPKENYSAYNAFFFVAAVVYLIVGALFVMNLFVGFIVDGFNANKGSSDAELQYSRFLRGIKEHRPRRSANKDPQNALSQSLRNLVTSKHFQTFSLLCVLVNVIFMLADHANMTEDFRRLMDLQNDIFLFELCGEMLLFFLAYGWTCFVTDPWKGFDLFVCLGTVAFQYIVQERRIAQFAKSFRLMRIIRLMKMIKPIRVILETLIQSVPQLLNVLLLLVLVYSMFAVVAVQSFGTTKYGQRLGSTANFEKWTNAMTAIYQMVTGDEWMLLMEDCSVMPPSCTYRFRQTWEYAGITYNENDAYTGEDLPFGDCGSPYARLYFMFFMLICESVMLNLFIGMILDNFSFITDQVAEVEDPNWDTGATSTQIIKMAETFSTFDDGSGSMSMTSVQGLMRELDQPLGFRDVHGHRVFTLQDRSAQRLIRAELNVLARERFEEAQEEKATRSSRVKNALFGWWINRRSASQKRARARERVSFEEVMVTMLYWRKPSMVPDNVKTARRERVKDTLLMMHALTVKDFMRTPVNRKVLQELNKALIHIKDFQQWGREDPDFARRFRFISATRRRDKARAARSPIYRNLKSVPPVVVEKVELIHLDHEPRAMIRHHDKVRVSQQVKFPKPITGALGFLSEIKTHAVVLKFVDARHGHVGLVACDLSQCEWLGWNTAEGQTDALYQPRIRKGRVDEAPAVWGRVLLTMREQTLTGEELDLVEVGSLLDVQGFIRYSSVNEAGQPKDPVSALRLNVGEFRITAPQAHSSLSVAGMGFLSAHARSAPRSPDSGALLSALGSFTGKLSTLSGTVRSRLKRLSHHTLEPSAAAAPHVECKDAVLEVLGYLDLPTLRRLADPTQRALARRTSSASTDSAPVQRSGSAVSHPHADADGARTGEAAGLAEGGGYMDARQLASMTQAEFNGSDADEDAAMANPL